MPAAKIAGRGAATPSYPDSAGMAYWVNVPPA